MTAKRAGTRIHQEISSKAPRENLYVMGYHALENEKDAAFTVAGRWIHARIPFAEVIKSLGEDKAKGTIAYDAYLQIQNIYHTDNVFSKFRHLRGRRSERSV